MALIPIAKSLYPLVPKALGVPTLLRSAARLADTLTFGFLGIGAALDKLIGADPVKWGVFDPSGAKIAPYTSVFGLAYQNESRLSDYPIEMGSFATYNKVDNPFDVHVTLICTGTETERSQFAAAIETARKGLTLYTVTTPEYTYEKVNFVTLAISRETREGAHVIIANMGGREVRERPAAKYSSPENPAAADTATQGQVQTVDDPNFDTSGVA